MLLHTVLMLGLLTAAGPPIQSRMLIPVAVTPLTSSSEALEDIVIGDFNCDGKDDVAAPTYLGRVIVANGSSNGFSVSAGRSGTEFLRGAATGDFNDDGCADFTAVDSGAGKTVAMGSAQGLVSAAGSPIDTPFTPWGVDVADFNADGRDDLVSVAAGTDLAHLFLANANGGFSVAGTWPLGRNSIHVQAGDLDGNLTPDLFVTNHNAFTGSVLLNDGAGGFQTAAPVPLLAWPCRPVLVDLDADGDLDALVLSGEQYKIAMYRGDGAGGFAPGTTIGTGLPFGCAQYAVTDLDANGRLDVVIPNYDKILVLYQQLDGEFRSAITEAFLSFRGLVAHDLDADGHDDILATGQGNAGWVLVELLAPLFATGFE